MKKRSLFAIVLCVALCGCGRARQEALPVPEPTPPPLAQAETEPCAVGTVLQSQVRGDLTAVDFPLPNTRDLRMMGCSLLVLSGGNPATLTRVTVPEMMVEAKFTLDFYLAEDDPSLVVGADTISVYNPAEGCTLVLDDNGRQLRRIPAPPGAIGIPVLCMETNTLYYTTDTGLCAWLLDSGIRRTILETKRELTVKQVLAGGSLIRCETDGQTVLLDAGNGAQVDSAPGDLQLQIRDGKYYASFSPGEIQLPLWGCIGEDATLLLPEDYYGRVVFLPDSGAALNISSRLSGCSLNCYDLETGGKGASLTLDCSREPIIAGSMGSSIYFLIPAPGSGSRLYRWDALGEQAVYTGCYAYPYIQAEDALPVEEAKRIGSKFGITIRLGEDAARVQPWDYAIHPEPLAPLLARELDRLEGWLECYPPELLRATAQHFGSLEICLVRQLTGTSPGESVEKAAGVQFFENDRAYLALTLGKVAEQTLYHEMYHLMQTHLITGTSLLDRWEDLNPQGFQYDYDYTLNDRRSPWEYLTPGSAYFIDTYSMCFPKEDQARIMEYAMTPGHEAQFRSPYLQMKLRTLCLAIRDAYHLEEVQDTFLWEQYLY